MDVTITFEIGLAQETRDWIMSVLSDAIAKLNASADAAITRVQADLDQLHAQIAALQATVDSGGATPADLQALADLQAKIDGKLDPSLPPAPAAASAVKRH